MWGNPSESQVRKNVLKCLLTFTINTQLPCEFLRSLHTHPGPSIETKGPQWEGGAGREGLVGPKLCFFFSSSFDLNVELKT